MPVKALSEGEECLALHLRAHNIPFEREYRFHVSRRYRFDFFIAPNIGIEVEGGIWSSGRHSRGAGMENDMRKYNLAATEGFFVLRYSTSMIQSGEAIAQIRDYLGGSPAHFGLCFRISRAPNS